MSEFWYNEVGDITKFYQKKSKFLASLFGPGTVYVPLEFARFQPLNRILQKKEGSEIDEIRHILNKKERKNQ